MADAEISPGQQKAFRLERFSGVDTLNDTHTIGLDGLAMAVNVDATAQSTYRRRAGRSRVYTGNMVAGWSDGTRMFALESVGGLRRLLQVDHAGNVTPVAEGLLGDFLTGAHVGGTTYLSTGGQLLAVTDSGYRAVGVAPPRYVTAAAGPGALLPGTYLYTATTVAPDGRESGSLGVKKVTLTEPGGLTITASSAAGSTRIYVSGPNGEQLFLRGQGSVTLNRPVYDTTVPLTRRYGGPPPAGSILALHNGRLLVADGSVLWYSMPFDYEFVEYGSGAIPFESALTMLLPLDTGLFVSDSSSISFLAGDVAAPERLSLAYPNPAFAGTAVLVPLDQVGDGTMSGIGGMFAARTGVCLAAPDGSVRCLTQRRLQMPQPLRATAHVRGNTRYVVSMQ